MPGEFQVGEGWSCWASQEPWTIPLVTQPFNSKAERFTVVSFGNLLSGQVLHAMPFQRVLIALGTI